MEDDLEKLPASGPLTAEPSAAALTRKDFISDQMVRWCPGCGDFAILATVQKLMPTLGIPREKFVFVSGIGCSSRFPYYMNTFGFHSIHGRAATIATGLKCARPDLQVWVATGDGDGLSIGGNHLIHALRRNVDIKIMLFNNKIYGLTKGQASPTSELGKKTKSTPMGSIDHPINPISLALASEATFVARVVDTDLNFLGEVLAQAARHKGSAFIEILQNCVVFNDGAWTDVSDKATREDKILRLRHGQPLIFGKDSNRGIRLNGLAPEIVAFEKGNPPKDLLVHDEKAPTLTLAYMLAEMTDPKFPMPMGIFRTADRPALHELMDDQISAAKEKAPADLQKLLAGSETWVVQ